MKKTKLPKAIKQLVWVMQQLLPADGNLSPKIVQHLYEVKPYIEKLNAKERDLFLAQLEAINFCSAAKPYLYTFLLKIFQREDFIVQLDNWVKTSILPTDINVVNNWLWQMKSVCFTHSHLCSKKTKREIYEGTLRPLYQNTVALIKPLIDEAMDWPAREMATLKPLRKIALISPQLLSMGHAPTRAATMMAAYLKKTFALDVYVYNLNSLPVRQEFCYTALSATVSKHLAGRQEVPIEHADWDDLTLRFVSFNPEPFGVGKAMAILHDLKAEQFDAVIFMGENFFIPDFVYGHIPSYFVPMQTDIPMIQADGYLLIQSSLKEAEEQLIEQLGIGDKVYRGLGLTPLMDKIETLQRSQFDVPEDAYVFAIVGTRLKLELSPSFINICETVLFSNPAVYLFIIGGDVNVDDHFSKQALATGRIKALGFQPNLRGIFELCDAYLDPFRAGGGSAGQMAILDNLAIVTLEGSDLATIAGPELTCQTPEHYLKLALDISSNPQTHAAWMAKSQAKQAGLLHTEAEIDRILAHLCQLGGLQMPEKRLDPTNPADTDPIVLCHNTKRDTTASLP